MATGEAEEERYSLVKVGTVTLENTTNERPNYISFVICQYKIIVINDYPDKVQIHQLHDGKFLDMLVCEYSPFDICLMDATTICVIHDNGQIEMESIKLENMSPLSLKLNSLCLQEVFDIFRSVGTVNDKIVAVGVKQDTTCWCTASLYDGHVDTIHRICKMSYSSYVTTKDNIIYISCCGVDDDDTGVYGFDISNPSQCKYKYKHQRLQKPISIVINEDGNIFVANADQYDFCIHQLTASCQPVAIFTQGIPRNLQAIFWYSARLYVACIGKPNITIFQHVYEGSHKPSEVLVSDERKQRGIEESAMQIAQGNPIEQSVEEELNQAGIKMSTEERDLFIKFQKEIGTDIFFSKGPHSLIDGQETLKATEVFIEQSHPDMKDTWLEYKSQGKLTPELIDVIYAKERNQELHQNKDLFLKKMEQLNIIVKARAFNENGVKEENYFFTPCMLHKESPREVIAPEKDVRTVSTPVLCWVITGTSMPPGIFQKLIAACLSQWPVAKKKNTPESLMFRNCTVFDLDPIHRLFLHCENPAVFARITKMGIDHINAKMCTRVRKFITLNLSHNDPNLKYQLCLQNIESQDIPEHIGTRFSPPFEMWFVDEVHDPAAPITREHMNHARLCVATVAICGKAMRTILLANPSLPHKTIYKAIVANKTKLISRTQYKPGKWRKALLNKDQRKMLFPDPRRQYMTSIDQFDIALLYNLIKHVSRVKPPSTGWGVAPQDKPRDKSLGANVERIHLYRNEICGHSVDGQISQQDFEDYWKKIDLVLHDIDVIVGQAFSQELKKQRRQVISVYEAC